MQNRFALAARVFATLSICLLILALAGSAGGGRNQDGKFVTVNGVRIHYLEWGGEGPSIVLLHGMSDDAGTWEKLAPLLAPGFRIIAPDRRGSGESDKSTEGYDFQTLVNDVASLAESLKLGPLIVVGHSFGAEIALNFAARKPALTRSVILVDGGFWPKQPAGSEPPGSAIEKTSRGHDPAALYPAVAVPVLLVFARGSGPGAEVITKLKEQGIDFFEEVNKKRNRALDLARRYLRRMQVASIEKTGHWIQVDQPRALAQVIREFVAGGEPRRQITGSKTSSGGRS